jgi:hypothetical protein
MLVKVRLSSKLNVSLTFCRKNQRKKLVLVNFLNYYYKLYGSIVLKIEVAVDKTGTNLKFIETTTRKDNAWQGR